MVIEHTYFEQVEPLVDDSGVTYTDVDRRISNRRSFEWNHGIGETVSALIASGLRIDKLSEHDWTLWPRFSWLVADNEGLWTLPPGMARVPLTFTVVASAAR